MALISGFTAIFSVFESQRYIRTDFVMSERIPDRRFSALCSAKQHKAFNLLSFRPSFNPPPSWWVVSTNAQKTALQERLV